jgi:phosphate transport system permease protein
MPHQRRLPVRPRRSGFEWIIETLIRVLGVSTIGLVAIIFVFLLIEGVPAFIRAPLDNLFGTRWYPTSGLFGTIPLLLGSLVVTVTAMIIAFPLGVCTAVFIREVAPNWAREVLKPVIEVLAGIPSVVRESLGAPTGLTALTGALVLAYMSLPTIISVAEDALDAVPRSYRDAGLAMGATQWQTIWRVVVPAARSGILMALMLGMGRAIGETMAVMMVTGNAARLPDSLTALIRPIRTMTATIAAEMGEVASGSTHYHVLFGIALVLFLFVLAITLASSRVMFRRRERGGLR